VHVLSEFLTLLRSVRHDVYKEAVSDLGISSRIQSLMSG
jgi:hypothetical protein